MNTLPSSVVLNYRNSIFEQMLGDINYEDDTNLYPFKVRVGVPYRRPPRHPWWEFLLEMGHPDINKLFFNQSFGGRSTLMFVFPERWTNVSEQRQFMPALKEHPEVKTIKQVDIITHSPLIVGNFKSFMIRSLKWEDDILYEYEKKVSFDM